ncbi:photosystem II reaction center protein Psb28 [Rubidibacter lacunae KORDI 51-2]|uniref:Photosystem II reaction center Psb28 protein n=1 Tax=Rubidibacter lacunae KORDI 51-2 TaxID=582515 RepID=U5DS07_9CHRO|nr:photosystem II reaction center protein Psb28 [Rubidibacter lacunae]ERN42470.1 photosystem II reaction center protein Psb28 [Rubidibacter lacunae KORDI 51-2]
MANIQFTRGINEETVPDVRLTRSRDGSSGTATFRFEDPQVLSSEYSDEITGMYLVDEEGEISTLEVKGKFRNGQARAVEAILYMRSQEEWDRFMRFMERYAAQNGLGFSSAT